MANLVVVEGDWIRTLSGVPGIIAGAAFAAAAFLLQPLVFAGYIMKAVLILCGIGFSCVGVWQSLGRVALTIDRERGVVYRRINNARYAPPSVFDASHVTSVRVTPLRVNGPFGGALTVWATQLIGGDLNIRIRFAARSQAISAADAVGTFLSVPVLLDRG